MPSEYSATRKPDRPMIKRMAMRIKITNLLVFLSSRSSSPYVLGRKRLVGHRTPRNRMKNTVNEMTCRARPAMMMLWPVDTPPSSETSSVKETPPPEAWMSSAKISLGMNMRAYSRGRMLKMPLPR